MEISNDNKYLAIAEANLAGIAVQSNIRIISIETAQTNPTEAIVYTHTAEIGDLILKIKYNHRNHLISMYDTYVDSIIDNYRNVDLFDFSNGEALFVDINLDSHIAKVTTEIVETLEHIIELQIIDNIITDRLNRFELTRGSKNCTHIWKYDRNKFRKRSIIYK
jgi:hypothetical protein